MITILGFADQIKSHRGPHLARRPYAGYSCFKAYCAIRVRSDDQKFPPNYTVPAKDCDNLIDFDLF